MMIGLGLSIPSLVARRRPANQAPPGSPIPTSAPVIAASNGGVHPCTLSVTSSAVWTNNPTSKSFQWRKNNVAFGAATATPQSIDTDGPGNWRLTETATNANGSNFSNSNTIAVTEAAATVPAKMAAPTLTPADRQITVARAAPPATGGSAITSYDARHSADGGTNWTTVPNIGASQIVAGLTNGTAYQVQTRAVNAVGAGAWSDSATATPVAAQATVFRDDFNRADGTLVGSDANWTTASGNGNALTIANNQLATLAAEGAFFSPDLGNPNQYAKHLVTGGGAVGPFIVCRLTDQNNWGSAVRYNVNTGAGQVWKRTGGTLSQYGSTTGSPCVVGATLEVQTVGDMTQLVVNGVVAAGPYAMDGAGAGVTRSGYVTRTNANSPWADNYENGHLAALTT